MKCPNTVDQFVSCLNTQQVCGAWLPLFQIIHHSSLNDSLITNSMVLNVHPFLTSLPLGKSLPFATFFKNFLFSAASTGIVLYVLFQKKLLPRSIARVVSKVMFYPTFPLTAMMRIGNYWTVVDDTIILGCAPMGFLDHPKQMHTLGIRGVVNMCEEYSGPQTQYAELGMRQLRLPVVDHEEPSLEYMKESVRFIQQYKEKGQKVYIHCKAGHGRGAAIALCWMIQQNPKLSPKVSSSS